MSTRREFLEQLAVGGAAVGAILTSACGDDDGGGAGGDGGTCTPNPQIASNHGHTLTIPAADVAAGASRTYSIQGSSPHDHMVTITATGFSQLRGGNAVPVISTTDNDHEHTITITCA